MRSDPVQTCGSVCLTTNWKPKLSLCKRNSSLRGTPHNLNGKNLCTVTGNPSETSPKMRIVCATPIALPKVIPSGKEQLATRLASGSTPLLQYILMAPFFESAVAVPMPQAMPGIFLPNSRYCRMLTRRPETCRRFARIIFALQEVPS